MFFTDWKKHPKCEFPKQLLWEYDTSNFTQKQWKNISLTATQRVIELGKYDDWYALLQLYGGPNKIIKLIKKIPDIDIIDKNFLKIAFGLQDKDFLCSTTKQ